MTHRHRHRDAYRQKTQTDRQTHIHTHKISLPVNLAAFNGPFTLTYMCKVPPTGKLALLQPVEDQCYYDNFVTMTTKITECHKELFTAYSKELL